MTSVPFDEHRDVVRPEWIDDNGHPNMGSYGMACRRAGCEPLKPSQGIPE